MPKDTPTDDQEKIVSPLGDSRELETQTILAAGLAPGAITLTDGDDIFLHDGSASGVEVSAGQGQDVLVTGDDTDLIYGGDDSDQLLSGGGDDTLVGGAGSDILSGGEGQDLFVVNFGDFTSGLIESDTITDFASGTDRILIAGFASLTSFDDLQFLALPSGLAVRLSDQHFIVLEGYSDPAELQPTDFEFQPDETPPAEPVGAAAELTDTDDRLILSGNVSRSVDALAGNDVIVTDDGADSIKGGAGSDQLIAGAAADVLEGGPGQDILTGGSGSDRFVFRASDFAGSAPFIADTITDFESGIDTIVLDGFGIADFASVETLVVPAGLALQVGANRFIILEGITAKTDLQAGDFEFVNGPVSPPSISLLLSDDTGRSGSDRITMDAGVLGVVTDDGTVTLLEVSLNGGDFADVTTGLSPTGQYSITQEALETALGGPVPEGASTLTIRATDNTGESATAQLTFTYDATAPGLANLALSTSSDTGTKGDGITSLRVVRIVGEGEPGATVSDGTVSTLVGVDGTFALSGVSVAIGDNTIELTTTDKAGNSSTSQIEVTGIEAVPGDAPVLTWNQITLDAIVDNAANPMKAARALAMQSVAVYDVVAAIDGLQAFQVSRDAPDIVSLNAAIAAASFEVLKYAFPAFTPELDAYLAEALALVEDGEAEDNGVALGKAIAAGVIAVRSVDGYEDYAAYDGSTEVGEWRPTGPFFNVAADPQAATMATWTLESPDQFRPDGPPDLTSAEYAAAVNEVKEIGALASTTRTADQTLAARFWADGLGTETTPGHYNSIAADLMLNDGTGAGDNARVLAVLNVAIADAMIAAWDTKYHYALWRPSTAIRNADADGNADTTADATWRPFLTDPAHPEYVSGHAAASGAAAEALTALLGERSFTTSSLGVAGVERSFDNFWQAAQENADSRLWGGVHYDFSNLVGLDLGAAVAQEAMTVFNSSIDEAAPIVLVDVSVGYTSNLPFEINGAALDTLSGVARTFYTLNGGVEQALELSTQNGFTVTLDGVPDGTYEFVFGAEDAAGNSATTITSTIYVDTADPAVTLSSLTDGALSGAGARLTGSIDGTGTPIIALAYRIDGGKTTGIAFNKTTGAFDTALNLSSVGIGEHTVTLIAVDAAGNTLLSDIVLTLNEEIPFEVTGFAPEDDSGEVGVTFRPEVHFSRAVDPDTLTSDSFYAVDAAGRKLGANIVTSPDGLTAYLFFDAAMPGANKITVKLDGSIVADTSGVLLDGDADGAAGGNFLSNFTTVSRSVSPGTKLVGFVVDPGNDLKPMTNDDFQSGPDGAPFTDDDVFLSPIVGAEVWILGNEAVKVLTDENGYFELAGIPAGNVKVAIDGRTASNPPEGYFWPEMVMDATLIAGATNTVMSSMGTTDSQLAHVGRQEVYLPRIDSSILTDLSTTEETVIGTTPDATEDLTAAESALIQLVVQPGSAVDEFGNPVEGAQVGISAVPPELVADMLPAGILQHTFDLTIQAPDSAVFTQPAALTVPNVFDAEPGTKLNLLSFDHTTGRLVIEGTGTVSADGLTITTDPDTGITKPGWHGWTPPGSDTDIPDSDEDNNPDDDDNEDEEKPCEDDTDGLDAAEDLSGVLSDLANCLKLFGPFKVASTAFDVAVIMIEMTKLAARLTDAVRDMDNALRNGEDLTAAAQALEAIDSLKDAAVATYDAATDAIDKNPVADGIACAKGLIGVADTACNNFVNGPCNDASDGWQALCDGVFVAKQAVAAAEAIYDGWKNGLKEAGLTALCASVDILKDSYFRATSGANEPGFAAFSANEPDAAIDDVLAAIQLVLADAAIVEDKAVEATAIVENGLGSDLDHVPALADDLVATMMRAVDQTFGLEQGGGYYYLVTVNGEEVRGYSDGSSFNVFLPPESVFDVAAFNPTSGKFAYYSGVTEVSGQDTKVPPLFFTKPHGELFSILDTDGEGLSDFAEHIVGTSKDLVDTDGDGLSDYIEVVEGLNPLGDFPNASGIVNVLELGSAVVDIHVARDPGDLDGNIAMVVTATGLSVVDISVARMPSLLSQVDFDSGTPVDCAFDDALDVMLVVFANGDVKTYDMSSPATPVETATLTDEAEEVEVFDSYAVVGRNGALKLFEISTGEEIDSAQLGFASSVFGLAQAGGFVYALDNRGDLHVAEVLDGALLLRGSVATGLNSRARDIFAADGVVFIGGDNGFTEGLKSFDVSNPDAPTLISNVDDAGIAGRYIALNGSGRALTGGAPGRLNAIDVLDVSDPSNTGNLITRYDTEATPTAISIAGGIGYVGDAAGNFLVVNFQSFDAAGIAPVATLTSNDIDVDPSTDGVQILEGTRLSLDGAITDDVGVREVSLLINGEAVSVDITYPFEILAQLPVLLPDEESREVTLQLRAVDTGGNIGLSDVIVAQIVPDTIPPVLQGSSVSEGALYGRSVRSFTFTFDEPLDPATVTADNFALNGPSGAVSPALIQLRGGDRSITLTYNELPEGAYSFDLSAADITDVAGNPMGDLPVSIAFEVGTFSNEWQGAAGVTNWDDAANWTAGRIPEATDDLFIGVAGEQSVVLPAFAGAIIVETMISEEAIVVPSGTTLVVNGELVASEIRVEGGVLRLNGPSQIEKLVITSNGRVDGDGDISVTGVLDWDSGYIAGAGDLTVENGAIATMGFTSNFEAGFFPQSGLYLSRTITLDGDGLLDGGVLRLNEYVYNPDTALNELFVGQLIVSAGSELELRSYRADMQYWGASGEGGLINQGTLVKTGGGTSQVVLATETLGQVETQYGSISLPSGTTLRITSQADLAGLSELTLEGGELILDADIVLPKLTVINGSVSGDGDLTITDTLDWRGGEIGGLGRLILPEGATANFGEVHDADAGNFVSGLNLWRNFDVAGEVNHGNALTYLGWREYNSETFQYEYIDTVINVTGTYRFDGPNGQQSLRFNETVLAATGMTNAGVVEKTGPGTAGVALTGEQTGSFNLLEGRLEASDGIFTVTSAMVAQGFDSIIVNGGTVILDEDVALAEIFVRSGTLIADAAVTTQSLNWTGGRIEGAGGIELLAGGTGLIGNPFDINNLSAPSVDLDTVLTVSGDLTLGSGRMFLGDRYYDAELAQYVVEPGQIIVAEGGTFTMESPASNIFGNWAQSGVRVEGNFVKSGGGSSSLPLLDGSTGLFAFVDGTIEFAAGQAVVTQSMVAAGLTDIIVTGGIVTIDDDVTLNSLTITNGTLTGAGNITVTGHAELGAGVLHGAGELTLAASATGNFGWPIEQSTGIRSITLAKTLNLEGEMETGNARITLGGRFYDNAEAVYSDYSGGWINIADTGTLNINNTRTSTYIRVDVTTQNALGENYGIINAGTIDKTFSDIGYGISLLQSTGTILSAPGILTQQNGAVFSVDAATNDAGLILIEFGNGSTLDITENVNLDVVNLTGGRLIGDGDLTIDTLLNWSGGTIEAGGTLKVAAGADAVIGFPTDPNNPTSFTNLYLERLFEIEGDAIMESARVRLGDYYYDGNLAQYINTPGVLDVLAGGTLRLTGDNSDFTARFATTNDNAVVNGGTIIKAGGGTSSFGSGAVLTGTGLFITEDGTISVGSGSTLVVTSGMLLSDVQLSGGVIEVQSGGTIENLTVTSGTLDGAGDLTVTGMLHWTGGTMLGTGSTIVATTGELLIGTIDDFANATGNSTVTLARDFQMNGTGIIEEGTLRMGTSSPNTSGSFTIGVTGEMTLAGRNSDVTFLRETSDVEPNVFVNNGTLIKSGGGTSVIDARVVFTDNGTVLATDGLLDTGSTDYGSYTPPATAPIHAEVVVAGETREIFAADGISEITVNGSSAVLVVNEDITLTNFSMLNGTVEGTGTITVTGEFFWEDGRFAPGGDIVIAAGATGIIGELKNIDVPVNNGTLVLGREMIVDGDVTQSQAQLGLGANYGGVVSSGFLTVGSTGSFTLDGYLADINRRYNGTDQPVSQVVVDGTLTKTGGGESTVNVPISGAGVILQDDGILRLTSGATLSVTQALDLSGVQKVVIDGGVLSIDQDVSLAAVELRGGTITGTGDLTLTDGLDFISGTIEGSGTLTLASGSQSVFGRGIDPLAPNTANSLFLERATLLEGDATVARAYVYLGGSFRDDLNQTVYTTGNIEIASNATLTLWGDRSDLDIRYQFQDTTSGVFGTGTVIKTGGGTSRWTPREEDGSLTYDIIDGTLMLAEGTFVLTAADVAAGLTSFQLNGGVLVVAEDVTLDDLWVSGGSVWGPGDLTISGQLDLTGGSINGTGKLIVPNGAEMVLGSNTQYLGRDLDLGGTLTKASGQLYLGYDANDPTNDNTYVEGGGFIDILATGEMRLGSAGQTVTVGLWSGPPSEGVNGVQNGGLLTKLGETDVSVALAGDQTGTFDIQGGTLTIVNGEELLLTQALVDTGLDALTLNGGTLRVDADVTLPELNLNWGDLVGDGTLTISESFNWTGGTQSGAGTTVIAAGATAQFGRDYNAESPNSSEYGYLFRTMNVETSVDHNGFQLYLGTDIYNPETFDYDEVPGILSIAAGVDYRMVGPAADMLLNTFSGTTSGAVNNGTIVKLGGGETQLPLVGGTGSFDLVNGDLVLSGGSIELTQSLIDAGYERIIVNGGELIVGEALSVSELVVRGGEITSDFDLTVTESFDWTGGTLKFTPGASLSLAETSVSQWGSQYDAEQWNTLNYLTLLGDIDILGTVEMGNARIELGESVWTGSDYMVTGGTVDILSGGTLVMSGPNSDFYSGNYIYATNSESVEFGVENDGTLVKVNAGTSEIFFKDGSEGIFDLQSGDLRIGAYADPDNLADATTLTQQMVANGLTRIEVDESVLIIDEDLSLDGLEILATGWVLGSGDVTVTEHFVFDDGGMIGDGRTIIAEGATGIIGRETTGEVPRSETLTYLGRVLVVDGDVSLEQTEFYLGDTIDFANPAPGVIEVGTTGTFTFFGPHSDVQRLTSAEDDLISGIYSSGTIIKDGEGDTVIDETLVYENLGAFVYVSGQFDAPGGENDVFV